MSKKTLYIATEESGEVHCGGPGPLEVNVGARTVVEIVKLYGPLSASEVRVRLDFEPAEWVVEYRNPTTHEWEEKARWGCQESWPED